MKKTLLAVALLMATTGVFAQVNVNKTDAQQVPHALSQKKIDVNANKTAKKAVKATAEGATLLCDFSDASQYTIGHSDPHSGQGDWTDWVRLDTSANSLSQLSAYVTYPFGLSTPGNWARYWEGSDYANMSAGNGYAILEMINVMNQDKQNLSILNTWVKINTPIKTYNKKGIDIYISECMRKFNTDQYFIDWSRDENFTTYDSIEFNIRNIETESNEFKFGTIHVTLPTTTTQVPLISDDPEEDTYIRIRCYVPSSGNSQQPHGYFCAIDDIAWAETPDVRLDVISVEFLGGYYIIPEVVTVEPLLGDAILQNTGAQDLYNVKLQNYMAKGTVLAGQAYDGGDSIAYDWTAATINEGVMDTLSHDVYETTATDANNNEITVLRRYHELQAYDENQLNAGVDENGVGYYLIQNKMEYSFDRDGKTVDTTIDATAYNYRYYTLASSSESGLYRWTRDCGATREPFTYGYLMNNGAVYVGTANYTTRGYKVCLGYNAREFDGDVYAYGIEVVPAFDGTDDNGARKAYATAGTMIKGSLWKTDLNVEAWDDVLSQVSWGTDKVVESENYTVQTSDLNATLASDVQSEFNSIYLPFSYQGFALEENTLYFACYELVTSGQFAIAQSYAYTNVFRSGYSGVLNSDGEYGFFPNLVIWSPNITTAGYQYSWGNRFVYDNTPMIRLMVSSVKGGLENVTESTSSVNLFPNPVTDKAVLDYTLNTTGNVTINVTDVMGRTVLSYNEGMRHAGVANKANIEASKLANGTYFCTVSVDGAKATTTKLVVNK